MLYLIFGRKKCQNCGKLSQKEVLFCWSCGSSFGLRICAAGHQNPPWVQYCLTCGKDRSLMSHPHSVDRMSFDRHPTKPFTYSPNTRKGHSGFVWLVVGLGAVLLLLMALVVAMGW